MTKRRDYKNNLTFLCLAFCVSLLLVGCEGSSDGDSGGGGGGGGGGLSGTPGSTACLTDFASMVAQVDLANPSLGGQLYDKWWAAAGTAAPTTDQPLWAAQTTNTRTGADTWRCKECHGWDYAGANGAYGNTSNSHYTDFPGILDAATDSPINIFCAIHSGSNIDSRHDFSAEIAPVNILHITKFIIESQNVATPRGIIDTSSIITSTGTLNGANTTNGNMLYNNTNIGCGTANCHGPNGDLQHEPLGDLAVGNPWESLHKIRFGHPGSTPSMPAFSNTNIGTSLTLSESNDVLAYTQTLAAAPNTCATDSASIVGQIGLADAAQGGQLYDKWWAAAGAAAPTTDHPIWATQSTNIRTGADTWRCKECHGWDYAGVSGVYGDTANSHYTGFTGILGAANSPAIDVFCAIKSGTGITSTHNFSSQLSDIHILHLTKFITESQSGLMPLGMINTSGIISNAGVPIGANINNGDALYNNTGIGCASSNCHGPDGDVQHEPLGVLSVDNPWETLHKIRFGHPGSSPSMPAFSTSITLSDSNDVVAFTQTLGAGSGGGGGGTPPAASDAQLISMGGRLYDNWISETGSSVPPVNNPVWALQDTNTRTGATTWRCKECHGWDYKGAAGVYGPSSSHYTGFGGLLNTEKTEAEIVTYLTLGFFHAPSGEIMHRFDGMLTTPEMEALAKFIKQGMIDSSPYFGSDTIINGSFTDFQNGEYLYSFQGIGVMTGACELCHDADGRGEPGVVLGAVANTNPWEFLHKIRFGQPATAMPSMYDAVDPATGGLAFDIQDAVDVIQYSQSLPLQ